MVFYAIAFSFKIQAIFYAPLVVIAVLKGKLKPLSLVFLPAVYCLCALPAIIAGMPVFDALLGAYVKQVGEYPAITLHAPNLYQILPHWYANEPLGKMLVFFAIGVCAVFCTALYRAKYELSDKNLLLIAYLATCFSPSYCRICTSDISIFRTYLPWRSPLHSKRNLTYPPPPFTVRCAPSWYTSTIPA